MKRRRKKFSTVSRRMRNTIFTVCLLIFVLLALIDRLSPPRQIHSPPAATTGDQRELDEAKYDGKVFTVTNVVDGDTLDIDVPDGKYDHTRIRLLGVDTPETKNSRTGPMYYGQEASGFAASLAMDRKVTVHLDKISRTRDKYGRLLAYVELENGDILDEELIRQGYGYADSRFKHSFYNQYAQIEKAARNNGCGLWKNVTLEQLPQWLQRKNPAVLKTGSKN
ncbi:MAG: thermonuclease family protein [Phycisphaerae bacterium]|nr:thermonuclease family protein [Phycisphaerae bacterium]